MSRVCKPVTARLCCIISAIFIGHMLLIYTDSP